MFRFSIRDMMLVLPLLAVCFAWMCERGRLEVTQGQVTKLRAELLEQKVKSLDRETAQMAAFGKLPEKLVRYRLLRNFS